MDEVTKQCPYCGESILQVATKCKFCGSMLNKSLNEFILADQPANLWRGIETVGGRIRVTNKRIVFEGHKLNLHGFPTEIPLDNIATIERSNSLGIIPNQMVINLKSGVKYKFVVNGRSKLITLIENELKKVRD